jgi:hypothetical protein
VAIEMQRLGRRKSVQCFFVLVLAAAPLLASCALTPPGELGFPVFTVPFLLEDATLLTDSRIGVAWETDSGLHWVYAAPDNFLDATLAIYESAPDKAVDVYDGAARLVFFAGSERRLAAINDGGTGNDEPLAQTRSSIWSVRSSGARLPFAAPVIDGEESADILFVDSADPVARRCGDDAVANGATCGSDCKVGDGFAVADVGSCCSDAHAAFVACEALVPVPFVDGELENENPPPVRLRVFQ